MGDSGEERGREWRIVGKKGRESGLQQGFVLCPSMLVKTKDANHVQTTISSLKV